MFLGVVLVIVGLAGIVVSSVVAKSRIEGVFGSFNAVTKEMSVGKNIVPTWISLAGMLAWLAVPAGLVAMVVSVLS